MRLDVVDDRLGFLGALGGVAFVADADDVDPGRISAELTCGGELAVGLQPALVGQGRHRCAHGRVHAVGAVEEVAAFGGQGALTFDQPAECGPVDGLGVGALADLRQLLRVAQQQQVGGRRCDGNGVGQAELAGFVDHQQVEAARRNTVRVGEVPGRTPDDAAGCADDESGVLALADLLPADLRVAVGSLLGDALRIDTGVDRAAQQVLHDGVRLRDDADPPTMLGDKPFDDVRAGEGFAGSRGSVHGDIRRVEVEQGRGDVVDAVSGSGQLCAAAGTGPAAQQDVEHRGAGQLRQAGRDGRGDRVNRVSQRRRRNRLARCQGERELVKGAAVLGCSLQDDHVGRRGRIVGLEHLGAPCGAPIRVVGETGRGRRLVEREDLAVQRAAG